MFSECDWSLLLTICDCVDTKDAKGEKQLKAVQPSVHVINPILTVKNYNFTLPGVISLLTCFLQRDNQKDKWGGKITAKTVRVLQNEKLEIKVHLPRTYTHTFPTTTTFFFQRQIFFIALAILGLSVKTKLASN